MATVDQVLAVEAAEVGYREGKNNSNKYGKEYGLDNQPYCVIGQWWSFKHAGCPELFYGGGKVALCSALYNYHAKRGQAVDPKNLRRGDILFFDFSGKKTGTDHVGIVESVQSDGIHTIEFNTSASSSGNQANGEGVCRKVRALKWVSKAYRPAYDDAPSTKGIPTDLFVRWIQRLIGAKEDGIAGKETYGKCPMVKTTTNQHHSVVYAVQVYLLSLGYDIGKSGPDGDYGGDTARAMIEFQKAKGLTADGELGPKTWEKLLT